MKRSPVLEDERLKFLNDFTPVVNQQEWVEEFSTEPSKPDLKRGEPRDLTLDLRSSFLKYLFSQEINSYKSTNPNG